MNAIALTSPLEEVLLHDPGVDPGYRHHPKRVCPGEPLELPGAVLKWYALHAADRPVSGTTAAAARRHLAQASLEARGFGFVLLHRCGEDFHFLIVSTWRNENELWETLYYRDRGMDGFAPFPRDGQHKPAFCVWELVPVWHEQRAWTRFLNSRRDVAAAEAWLADRCTGAA